PDRPDDQQRDRQPAAAERPEGHSLVAHVRDLDPEEHVAVLVTRERVHDDLLGRLVEREHPERRRGGAGPGAAASHRPPRRAASCAAPTPSTRTTLSRPDPPRTTAT